MESTQIIIIIIIISYVYNFQHSPHSCDQFCYVDSCQGLMALFKDHCSYCFRGLTLSHILNHSVKLG